MFDELRCRFCGIAATALNVLLMRTFLVRER
jgi:hypothetical protein